MIVTLLRQKLCNRIILTKQSTQKLTSILQRKNVPINNSSYQKRTFFSFLRPKTQRDFKEADNIPIEHPLIYRNTMSKYIYGTNVIIVLTTGIILFTFILNEDDVPYKMQYEEWSKRQKQIDNETIVFLTSFFAIIIMAQILISRTPLRIYKMLGTENYTLICPGSYPFSKERIVFKRRQIVPMESTGILPWRDFRYKIQYKNENKQVILLDHYFRRPADLHIMLGDQKDPDLDK